MRRGMAITLLGMSSAALGAAAVSPVSQLAGRYSKSFPNGLVDGTEYTSEDIVEIVTVDPKHSYVRLDLEFFNGHVCGLRGVARAEGDALVYREPGEPIGRKQCVLRIERKGAQLTWDNGDNSCSAYCGARGSFGDGALPWRSKRPITYLARLKGAREYRDALTEWRTGAKVNP